MAIRTMLKLLLIAAVVLSVLAAVQAKKDKQLYCGACRAVLDEASHAMSQVDPKKKVQIGSFRVDPKGNQGTYEIPYARSEVHLTELIEGICDKMTGYGESKDSETGRKQFVRYNRRDGLPVTLSNININADVQQALKHACETFVEEHEEDLIQMLRKDEKDLQTKACVDLAEVCDKDDLSYELDPPVAPPTPEPPVEEEEGEEGEEDEEEGAGGAEEPDNGAPDTDDSQASSPGVADATPAEERKDEL